MRHRMQVTLLVALALAFAVLAQGCGCQEEIEGNTTDTIDIARDEAAKAGILAIDTGIAATIAMNGAAPPAADQATLGGLVQPWPANPWTQQPMKPGTEPGDFTYESLGGTGYRLVGHLSDGGTFERP